MITMDKLRFWDSNKEIMLYKNSEHVLGYIDESEDISFDISDLLCELERFSCMLFTGFNDIHNVPIFEKDILKTRRNEFYEVRFIAGCFFLIRKSEFGIHREPMYSMINLIEAEVVGNVYELGEIR